MRGRKKSATKSTKDVKKASGGPAIADGNPKVIKEAKEGKNIGTIGGVKGKARMDRKARGGQVAHRANGGGVGSDTSPYSSAGKALKRGGSC